VRDPVVNPKCPDGIMGRKPDNLGLRTTQAES
jgi:hypothetical protein